jgi:hypothetical protein
MRLLQLGAKGELILTRDISYDIPPYAILSHTWGAGLDDEVTLQDVKENKGEGKPGYQKILFCGQQAERDGLKYFWVDTCCIDKTSSAELTEAINSMFCWYENAHKCYVYLADVSNSGRQADEPARSTWELAFRRSKWFSRGWTLQELIAPQTVEFFSSDCQRLGDKESLAKMIHEITKIPKNAFQGASLALFSVEERFSWSTGRTTTRAEDKAYSLLGIFDVSMTFIYGEGETKAIERLRAKISLRSPSGLLKQLPVAVGAAYDSHAEEHNQQCLAGTRTEILSEIAEWVHDPSSRTVYWLNGMAGTGKSTISRTLARQFSKSDGLGATFFFKRGEGDVGGISKFFTTIVSQLIQWWPGMAGGVQAIIEADPAILSRAMREQFQKLIIDPMSKISSHTDHHRSCLVIVDALDECEPQEDVKSLIHLLSSTKPLNNLHLKFFLTSRPELPIRMGFQAAKGTYHDFILHEVAQSAIEHDLTVYLKYELGKIREDFNQNGDDQLPANWPSQTALEMLVRIAIPLFISAATISRFIADSQLGNPKEQLEKVLKYEANDEFELDMTYSPILYSMISKRKKTVREHIVARFKTVVGSIIVLASPLSVFALAGLLDCKPSTIDATLVTLHSVLNVPKLPSQPIRLLHLSFRDFLVDPARRDDQFWIDEKQVHKQLASHCLRVLVDSLKTDICKVTAPGTPASSISEVEVNTHISPELQYACRFWVYHLHESLPAALDTTGIWHFLSTHFLQWLEALSWMCRLSESIPMIKSLQSIIPVRFRDGCHIMIGLT